MQLADAATDSGLPALLLVGLPLIGTIVGALIAGIVAYYTTKSNQKHARELDAAESKREIDLDQGVEPAADDWAATCACPAGPSIGTATPNPSSGKPPLTRSSKKPPGTDRPSTRSNRRRSTSRIELRLRAGVLFTRRSRSATRKSRHSDSILNIIKIVRI